MLRDRCSNPEVRWGAMCNFSHKYSKRDMKLLQALDAPTLYGPFDECSNWTMEYDRVRTGTAVRVLASLGDDDYAKFAQHRACV